MFIRILSILSLTVATLSGQYRTESWALEPGWNAIYLNLDTENRNLDLLLAGTPSITEVWQWRPNGLDPALGRANSDSSGADEWKVWRRGDLTNSSFSIPVANSSYLVRVAENAGPQTLRLKGKVVAPRVQWRSDGANLVGFPIKVGVTPTLTDVLGNAAVIDNNTAVFRYVGGPLSATNPVERPARLVNARRGEAFWVRSDQFTDFYGPVQVNVALDSGLNYGTDGTLKRLTLQNRTDEEVTVTVAPAASESAPGSSFALPAPMLTTRERDADSGLFVYSPLGASRTLTIPAKSIVGFSLGIDRAAMTGPAGTEFASLLKVTDSENLTEIYLPVTAEKASLAGLWIGEARVSRVQNQLQRFERGEDGNYLFDDDGNYLPLSGETGLNATAQEFKIKLLVHVNEAGQATLLNRVYAGIIADDGAGETLTGLSTSESSILPQHLKTAVRFSSSHFPNKLELNTKQTTTGNFAPGASLSSKIVLGANDSSNPFLHTFHPDHDNLDARFEETEPDGIESHKVTRAITLAINATAGPGEGPQWGTTLLSGNFSETITGIHKEPIAVSGLFALGKVSDIAILQTP